MAEPNTYMPIMSLDKEAGVVEFEVQCEGIGIKFDLDAERLAELISKLEDLQDTYGETQ